MIEPVRKALTVPLSPAEAFEVFTGGIGRWWPLATHSISQERTSSCAVEQRVGGHVYELRDDGERFNWATVTAWEPPQRLVLRWYPGMSENEATEVELSFKAAVSGGTLVELEHRNWERLGDKATESRQGYNSGWESVFMHHFARGCSEARRQSTGAA